MNEQVQIPCGTCCKVAVDRRSKHNAFERHSGNHLVVECFENGNQFDRIRKVLE